MVTLRRLPGAFGAEIRDLDLDRADGPALRELLEAFYAHQVIVVRDQRLTPAAFARFAGRFGRPQPHIKSELRHPDCPEILTLSNVFRDGKPIGVYDGAAYWHTDMSYEEPPGSATLVHALRVPETGGETLFADMYRAYEDLPSATRDRIDALQAEHRYGNRDDLDDASRTSAQPLTADQRRQARVVRHPLVRRHPVTGRKALYGVSGSSFAIAGLPQDAARALLAELKSHATRPDHVTRHKYAVGDVVVWDNFSTLHCATLIEPATGPSDTRLLHRISVKGLPPSLAGLRGAA